MACGRLHPTLKVACTIIPFADVEVEAQVSGGDPHKAPSFGDQTLLVWFQSLEETSRASSQRPIPG
jgi:hypothetical protein